MDANRKRRGFIKGNKLVMSLYSRSANNNNNNNKPTASTTVQFSSNKVNPTTPSSTTTSPVGTTYLVDHKEFAASPPSSNSFNKKVSFVKSDSFGLLNSSYYGGGDDHVDRRAASYISYVQERFKLSRVDSERWK